MKKAMAVLCAMTVLCGCTPKYEQGMYTDVNSTDFYEDAVAFCHDAGYMSGGDVFGVNDTVSLSECADIITKITGRGGSNPIEYVLEKGIAPGDFGEWDVPATRENVAYMIAHAIEMTDVNRVVEGAVTDARLSYAEKEIYSLYRAGIFAGDKKTCRFRPFDNVTRSEMAIIAQRVCNASKRAKFDMSRMEVSFIAFGDAIGHEPVIKAGKNAEGYDFTELFENVKVYIDNADIACVNQETIFVDSNFTGYPSFGSPEEIGEAEVKAGFDVVTHATNHAFDRGVKGILYTTQFWNNYPEIEMLGIHENEADAANIAVIEKNGIRIALLNYTYSLNGYRLPSGQGYMVDILNEEKIRTDMERARAMADAIVVFAHWGNEYQNTPAQSQRDWAQLFADCGATVIVGHHPHVVQPMEIVTSKGRNVPVYYSLGNFISNQNDYQNALCAMADFKIVKDNEGVRAESCRIEPVITHMEAGYYSAYLLKDYTEAQAARHKHRGKYGQKFTVEAYAQKFDEIVK